MRPRERLPAIWIDHRANKVVYWTRDRTETPVIHTYQDLCRLCLIFIDCLVYESRKRKSNLKRFYLKVYY